MIEAVGVIDLSYIFALFLFYYNFNCVTVPIHGQYKEDFAKNCTNTKYQFCDDADINFKRSKLRSFRPLSLSGFFFIFMRTWSMYKYLRSRFILNKSQLLRTVSLK